MTRRLDIGVIDEHCGVAVVLANGGWTFGGVGVQGGSLWGERRDPLAEGRHFRKQLAQRPSQPRVTPEQKLPHRPLYSAHRLLHTPHRESKSNEQKASAAKHADNACDAGGQLVDREG